MLGGGVQEEAGRGGAPSRAQASRGPGAGGRGRAPVGGEGGGQALVAAVGEVLQLLRKVVLQVVPGEGTQVYEERGGERKRRGRGEEEEDGREAGG